MPKYTTTELRQLLDDYCIRERSSIKRIADSNGICLSHLYNVLNGRQKLTDKLEARLLAVINSESKPTAEVNIKQPDLMARLRELALEQGLSISELVEKIILLRFAEVQKSADAPRVQ